MGSLSHFGFFELPRRRSNHPVGQVPKPRPDRMGLAVFEPEENALDEGAAVSFEDVALHVAQELADEFFIDWAGRQIGGYRGLGCGGRGAVHGRLLDG